MKPSVGTYLYGFCSPCAENIRAEKMKMSRKYRLYKRLRLCVFHKIKRRLVGKLLLVTVFRKRVHLAFGAGNAVAGMPGLVGMLIVVKTFGVYGYMECKRYRKSFFDLLFEKCRLRIRKIVI